ncbi:uncharacterized protein LOC126748107 isoform X3 [Anthonomus grandis grandis]|uniref:uncharacterized protein LOC126748107 isoform X3 n=1 Tax=Anthonomus grandis grandis TaxID=2921223 RepID=UPI0021651AD4|nr:uncharacterized protein LOC126748107 isoform X3 [Anthonomus grandis grandis]
MSTAMNNHAKSNSVVSAPNPSITNFLSNNGINSRVKQEKQDDPEIRELAAKLVEANKAKMAVPQKNSPSGQPPGMNILNYLGSDKNKNSSNNPLANSIQELKEIDEESSKGRFGWTLMGKTHIPYIIRSGENYVAVRMVELKVLNKWLNYLHQDLYNCTNIRSYYITEAEARLLNEINLKHCDYQFGREQFTQRDLIVRLADSNEFYQFLGHCYHKLVNNVENDMPNRCGFIRINRESVVPYTVYNDQKYVPLFYFEGETDNLKQRADKLEGWDLSYLKFCCKVQGIRNELFAHDSCSVISLNDIKNYFPPGTIFEDYWPKKNLDSTQLLVSGRNNAMPQNVHWTRQPAAPPMAAHPPPSPKPATQAKAASNGPLHHVYANNYGIAGGQPSYHSAQTRAASAAVRTTYPPAASTRHIRPSGGFYGTLSQAPPPPLVRSGTTYSTTRPIDMTQSPNPLINQNPAHQSSGRTQTSSDTNLVLANGRSSLSVATATKNKLINLPECSPPLNATSNIPYKIQKAQVQGKMLTLINMKSYVYSEHLITLQDLITNFFNGVPMQNCQQVLQVLGIDVFKANPSQVQVLLENNKCSSRNETIPLVQVRNVIDYMPQLKYMLSSKVAEVPAKRQRNS